LIAVFFAVGLWLPAWRQHRGAYAADDHCRELLHRSIPMVLRRLATLTRHVDPYICF